MTDALLAEPIVLIDGGLSTQLERMGHDVVGPLWTARLLVERPQVVEAAHRAFVDAGARVVITASYQVSREGFAEIGRDDADEALRRSVQVARAAAGDEALVAASVGPYGAITHDGAEYRGDYGLSVDELAAFHAERIAVLLDAEPDLLAVETIPDAREAQALIQVLDDSPDARAWFSFTAADGGHLWAGQTIEEAVRVVDGHRSVVAIGVNCTDPVHVPELLTRIRETTSLPLLAYPNAGGTWDATTGRWVDAGAGASQALAWRDAGASIIGGCCGTDAHVIRAMGASLLG